MAAQYESPEDINWLPEEIVKALQEGNLLLFCGAGVSKNAGLPMFEKLTANIAKEVFKIGLKCKDTKNYTDEKFTQLMKKCEYDTAISYLEDMKSDSRREIIKCLENELKITKQFSDYELKWHKIILKIAQSRSTKKLRLITTNFDNLFEQAAEKLNIADNLYSAPLIPPSARPDRWSGIVKIHGSLTTQDKSQGELVLSRGDFGRAYLEEGWTRRFIVDIFTHFHVLFIGYSLNDPMVRYIADAYALGRQNNNMHNKQAYIFLADYKEAYTSGIKVIKYIKCNDSSEPHEDLYNKLNILAKYKDEPYEKIKVIENFRKYPNDPKEHEILVKHLATDPKTISFFFRFKRDEAGTIADIKWLEYFTTNNVKLPIINEDLDAIKHSENNPNHHLISYWLCQHLDKAEFIDWLVKNNGIIHPILRTHLSRELKNYTSSPYYKIISLLMNNIILRSDYNYSDDNNVLIYLKQEIEQLHKCGQLEIIDAGLKLRILHALKPQTTINYDPNYRKDQYEQPEQAFLGMISLKIQDDSIRELKQLLETANIIADIAQELICLLKQYCEIEFLINPRNSKSYSKVKSIGDDVLEDRYNLKSLVELVRDSIKSLIKYKPQQGAALIAIMLAEGVAKPAYAVLVRLSLYLLTDHLEENADTKITLLWQYREYWLYKIDCQQEASYFIKKIWQDLSTEWQEKFWHEIREKREKLKQASDNEASDIDAIDICRRIAWVQEISPNIPDEMNDFLSTNNYNASEDTCKDSCYQKIEATYVITTYHKEVLDSEFINYSIEQHIALLKEAKDSDDIVCKPNNSSKLWYSWARKDFNKAFQTLKEIKEKEKEFFGKAWNSLIEAIDNPGTLNLTEFFTPLIDLNPEDFKLITPSLLYSQELRNKMSDISCKMFSKLFAKILPYAVEKNITNYCSSLRVLAQNLAPESYHRQAINHPYGQISEALISFMIAKSGGRRSEVDIEYFKDLFNKLLQAAQNKKCIIYANTILVRELYAMHVLLPGWTKENIIPLLKWPSSAQEENNIITPGTEAYNTYQYWLSYLCHRPSLTTELAEAIAHDLIASFEPKKLECFERDGMSELIDLALFMCKHKDMQITEIRAGLQKHSIRIDVLEVINKQLIYNKQNIGIEDYKFYKEVIDYLKLPKVKQSPTDYEHKEFKEISPILAEIFVRFLLSDIKDHAYIQEEWKDYWRLYLGQVKSTLHIFYAIKDRISKLNKQNIPIFLKFLVRIIDPSDLSFQLNGLPEILKRIKNIDKTVENNEDYKNLRSYLVY